jgi:DNA-binding transcriptional MocR family regulator
MPEIGKPAGRDSQYIRVRISEWHHTAPNKREPKSIRALAQELGVSRQYCQKLIRKLKDKGTSKTRLTRATLQPPKQVAPQPEPELLQSDSCLVKTSDTPKNENSDARLFERLERLTQDANPRIALPAIKALLRERRGPATAQNNAEAGAEADAGRDRLTRAINNLAAKRAGYVPPAEDTDTAGSSAERLQRALHRLYAR